MAVEVKMLSSHDSHPPANVGSGPLAVTRRRTAAVAAINEAFIAAGEQAPAMSNSHTNLCPLVLQL